MLSCWSFKKHDAIIEINKKKLKEAFDKRMDKVAEHLCKTANMHYYVYQTWLNGIPYRQQWTYKLIILSTSRIVFTVCPGAFLWVHPRIMFRNFKYMGTTLSGLWIFHYNLAAVELASLVYFPQDLKDIVYEYWACDYMVVHANDWRESLKLHWLDASPAF